MCVAAPAELTVGNMCRRVLFMIREEHNTKLRAQTEAAVAQQRSSSVTSSPHHPSHSQTPRRRGSSSDITISSVGVSGGSRPGQGGGSTGGAASSADMTEDVLSPMPLRPLIRNTPGKYGLLLSLC